MLLIVVLSFISIVCRSSIRSLWQSLSIQLNQVVSLFKFQLNSWIMSPSALLQRLQQMVLNEVQVKTLTRDSGFEYFSKHLHSKSIKVFSMQNRKVKICFTATFSMLIDTTPKIWLLNAAVKLHLMMLTNVLRSSMEFFDRTPVGRILARFSKDVDVVDSQLPQIMYSFCYCFFTVIVCFLVNSECECD